MSDPSPAAPAARRPRRAFAVLAPLFGLLYVFATPPFQSPDEPQHFYRAYQVSELGIIGQKTTGKPEPRAGGFLPKSLKRVAELVLDDIPHNEERHVEPQAIKSALAVPLEPDDREFLEFPTNVLYSPVPYAPQALGIFLGRMFQAPPIVLLYLARLLNLAVWFVFVYAAIRVTPVHRWVFLLLALAPMSIAQAASASADALANGAAFLLVASIFEAAFSPAATMERSRRRAITGLSLVVTLCKPVYSLLPVLVLLIPAAKFGSPRKFKKAAASLLALCWGTLAAWSAAVSPLAVPLQQGVSSSGQLRLILTQPLRFLDAVRHMISTHFFHHLREFVGQLGWLDVALPFALAILYILVLIFAALADKTGEISVRARPKALGLAVVLVSAAAIVTTIYIVWNPVGAGGIEGVQGRYFIPFGPLLLLLFYNRKISPLVEKIRVLRAALIAFSAFTLVFGLAALLSRYYLSFF